MANMSKYSGRFFRNNGLFRTTYRASPVIYRASPVIRIVKLFTQHVVRGDYWVPTNCSLTVNGGVASLIAWLDHSCQKTEVGGKQGHAPCRRILLQ